MRDLGELKQDVEQLKSQKENSSKKGKLKIFLGMAAGVGKTYAMLEYALKKKNEGFEVAIGSIDTHGRKETAKLLDGLKVIPEKSIFYKDKEFRELNLDEILKQKPQIVLVDELAHSNIQGCLHLKRWQDVEHILEVGIDVLTTINIQHVESLKDIVEQVTGIKITETIPDKVLENAHSIELIDITPQELIERLKEGKVYAKGFSRVALDHFFQEDKLTALREISLRFSADVVDRELGRLVERYKKNNKWKQKPRILLVIEPRKDFDIVVRVAKRLSNGLQASLIALSVDTDAILDNSQIENLSENINLAAQLGAEIINLHALSLKEGVEKIIQDRLISIVVVGSEKSNFFDKLFKANIQETLTQNLHEVDIYIVNTQEVFKEVVERDVSEFSDKNSLKNYLKISSLSVLISFLMYLSISYLNLSIAAFLFLIFISLFAFFFSKGPLVVSSFIFSISLYYFHRHPAHLLFENNFQDVLSSLLFLLLAACFSTFIAKSRHRQIFSLKRERSIELLYDLIKEIAQAPTFKHILKRLSKKIGTALDGVSFIVLEDTKKDVELDDKEKAVVEYVFENAKIAGYSTAILPMSKYLYIPMQSSDKVMGVIAFRPNDERVILPGEYQFLASVAQVFASYLQRHFSDENAFKIKAHEDIEKTYKKALDVISLELKPVYSMLEEVLIDIKANLTLQSTFVGSLKTLQNCLTSISSIMDNASSMSYLSSSIINFKKEAFEARSMIFNVVEKMRLELLEFTLILDVKENLPDIIADKALIETCLFHFLKNASENAPYQTKIKIEANISGQNFIINVLDEGPGIPQDKLDEVFKKFFRLPGAKTPALGLGLSISKSIAAIHQGDVLLQNRIPRGLKVSLVIPYH